MCSPKQYWRTARVAIVSLLFAAVSLSATGSDRALSRPGEIVIRHRQDVEWPTNGLSSLVAGHLSAPAKRLAIHAAGETWLLRVDTTARVDSLIKTLQSDPNVLSAEPNQVGALCLAPTDPLYPQTAGDLALIGAEQAWTVQDGIPGSVVVAIIDSGVDPLHADLSGAIDLARSYNFVDNNTVVFDDLGHGTRVAGVIGAVANNAEGIAGLAHGCVLLSLDAANERGEVTIADVIAALEWAVTNGAQVVNMSLAFQEPSEALSAACREAAQAGVILVAASGNENQGAQPVYPASCETVIGVGAVLDDGVTRAPWSNFNGDDDSLVELVAPGDTVFSTIPGSRYNGLYGSGTSFAAPMVAGAAALMTAHSPALSHGAVRARLSQTATTLGGWAGAGRLNAGDALATTPTPILSIDAVVIDDDPAYGAANDNDGQLDEGETVRLAVTLRNDGSDVAGLSGVLSSADPEVTIATPAATWGDVVHNGWAAPFTKTSDTAVFANLMYTSGAPTVKDVELSIDVMGNSGLFVDTLTFSLSTENAFTPPVIIATDTTWTSDRVYLIEANTVVMEGATLTIEPGTTLRFEPAGGLEIRGGLIAEGLSDDHISFVPADGMPGGGVESQRYAVGHKPLWVTLGDADNDGDIDMLAPNDYSAPQTPTDISCLFADAGSFLPEVRKSVGNTARNRSTNVIIADTDGDGVNELIYDGKRFIWDGSEFASTGTMTAQQYRDARDLHPSETSAQWDRVTVVAELTGDAFNDIATINPVTETVDILPWTGSGFDAPVTLSISFSSVALSVGDVDNDGDTDILVANTDTNDISIFAWNGVAYDPEQRHAVGVYPYSLAIADADNDGDNDVLIGHLTERAIHMLRWNGSAHDAAFELGDGSRDERVTGLVVADVTGDGYTDIVAANREPSDVGVFVWDGSLAGLKAYRGLSLRPSTSLASLAYCDVDGAPVVDASDVSTYADCAFTRSGEATSLLCESTTHTAVITRCSVIGNDGGAGLVAQARSLIGCLASGNAGLGLLGAALDECKSSDNGAGMSGVSAFNCLATDNDGIGIATSGSATACVATGNTNWGVDAQGDATDIQSSNNGAGLRGNVVDACIAEGNSGVGIQALARATSCQAIDNGGAGIVGGAVEDSVVVGNGQGLDLGAGGWVAESVISQNTGVGVTGGSVTSSVVTYNAGAGISEASIITNSWVVGNRGPGIQLTGAVTGSTISENDGVGVLGIAGPPYTTVTDCVIVDNKQAGVRAVEPVGGCVLTGNADFDYQETRLSTELTTANARGNFWGGATTALMDAHPFGTFYDIPAIHDFVDNTELAQVNYGGHLASWPGSAGPGDDTSAFLASIALEPGPGLLANIGLTTLTLSFNQAMDTGQPLAVTFGLDAPFSARVIAPANGWIDARTWRGTFAVESGLDSGWNTLRVSGALDDDGFTLPDDTSRGFQIDASGAGAANNGLAMGRSGTEMKLTWDGPDLMAPIGYNARRCKGTIAGPFVKVNPSPILATEYFDTGLEPDTIYYYIIDLVYSDGSSIQWTSIFEGRTLVGPNGPPKPRFLIVY